MNKMESLIKDIQELREITNLSEMARWMIGVGESEIQFSNDRKALALVVGSTRVSIPFDSNKFDFSQCNGVDSQVINRVKNVLDNPRALLAINKYYRKNIDPIRLSNELGVKLIF